MAVTADDLVKEVKGYNWDLLNGTYNEEDEIQRLILIKRALYELYSYAEQEAVAEDKKEDAMELLKAYLGSSVDSSGYTAGASQTPLSCGAIKK